MKKIHILLPMLAILLSCWSSPAFAQDNTSQTRVVIIKKSIDENGVETIEKTIREGEDANVFIMENNENGEFSFDIDGEGENSFSLEGLSENLEELQEQLGEMELSFLSDEGYTPLDLSKSNTFKSCKENNTKPFLGIYMQESIENENGVETIEGITDQGVIIESVIEGSAAEAAGLQKGDIITSIDGQATKRISNVSTAIQSKKIGDAISVSYIRDGIAKQTTATLKGKAAKQMHKNKKHRSIHSYNYNYDNNYKVDPCKVFIGVYTGTGSSTNGLRVNGVIENTPAFDAGLLKGDRILAIDGVAVESHNTLLAERNKHKPGDEFTITFQRDGDEVTVDATFKQCSEVTKVEVEKEVVENNAIERDVNTLLDVNLTAFPNPTNSAVNVRFVGEQVPTTITVTDIKGQEIFREELNDFNGLYNKKVSLNRAAAGPVIITVQQGKKVRSEKVLYVPERA